MRRIYRYSRKQGKVVDATEVIEEERREAMERRVNIMPDIEPYEAVGTTGEIIGSRSVHREHLKQHGMIEVGNEMPKFLKDWKQRQTDSERSHG